MLFATFAFKPCYPFGIVQSGSEWWTSSVFEWLKVVGSLNGWLFASIFNIWCQITESIIMFIQTRLELGLGHV